MFLGIDIGSSSSKAAVIDETGTLRSFCVIGMGTGTGAAEDVVKQALERANLTKEKILYTVATGYGRITYKEADEQVTEISCHGKGVSHLMPGSRTVIDIGGQDAKVIRLNGKGKVENFVMNEKCAAGTGRFLEVMAKILGCGIEKLSDYAKFSQQEVTISSTCTVFAESEVISQLAAGAKKEDVAKGAHRSVAKRVAGLCQRIGVVGEVAMTGGCSLNGNLVDALEKELNIPIHTTKKAQAMGAIGAAIIAMEKYEKRKKDSEGE